MPNKYVTLDGVAIFLHHRGPTTLPEVPPDLSRGEVVVCLHDAGGNGNVFAELLDRLADAHSPLALDFPAHARSGGLDSLDSVEAMAELVLALLARLELPAVVLLGDGMGSCVALELALQHPEAVRGLVLIGAATRCDIEPQRLDRLRLVTEGKARRELDRSGYAAQTPREVYRRAFAEWLKTDPRALYGDLQACGEWSAEDRLGDLSQPVLLVVGEEGEEEEAVAVQTLGGALDQTQTVSIPGAGRHSVLEQPASLAAAVADFLGELA